MVFLFPNLPPELSCMIEEFVAGQSLVEIRPKFNATLSELVEQTYFVANDLNIEANWKVVDSKRVEVPFYYTARKIDDCKIFYDITSVRMFKLGYKGITSHYGMNSGDLWKMYFKKKSMHSEMSRLGLILY